MSRLRWIACCALFVGLAPTCKYPTFSYGTGGDGAGGAGTASSSSSSSAASSAGSSSSSASSSSSTAASSGAPCVVQHAGGGTCEFLPNLECGCPSNKKCSVADETGKSICVFTGTKPAYAHCSLDADCGKGFYCNPNTQACEPFCVNTSDCTLGSGGQCIPVLQSDGKTPVPDVSVCAAHCDLVSGKPCGSNLNCRYLDGPKEFDCVFSKGLLEGSDCTSDADCAIKLGCASLFGGPSQCVRWCHPVGSSSPVGCFGIEACYGFNPPIEKDGIEYGVCGI